MTECKIGVSDSFTTQVPVVTPPIVDFLLSRMVLFKVLLFEFFRKSYMLLPYESFSPSPSWGEGLRLISDLLFLSLEPQVLDFSDDEDADLLEPSDFSLALPVGFCLETVQGLEL